MALKGDIGDVPIEQIFSLIESIKGTGKLLLESGSHSVIVHFMDGSLVNAEGDKNVISSLELALGFDKGSFEFDKTIDVKPAEKLDEVKKTYKNKGNIENDWKKIKKAFPSENFIINLSDASKDEVEITGGEWKIISILKQPISISELLKLSSLGVFKTFKVLMSIREKGLIEVGEEIVPEGSSTEEEGVVGNVVPVRNLGYWAMRSPIEGIKAIEFYRRVDDKKTLKEIAKEMGISIKEAKDIFDYLVKIDKLDKPKKMKV